MLVASPAYLEGGPPRAVTGTSISAPIVAGVVALMLAADSRTPSAKRRTKAYVQRIERGLQRTANPTLIGEVGFTPRTGYGALDAASAVAWMRKGDSP